MRNLILAGVLTLAAPSLGNAAPLCVAGTLDQYIALGASGCSVDSATFFDFTASVLLAGADPVAPANVTVSPTPGIGLDFGVAQAAMPTELFDVLIGFSISGATLGQNVLSMAGSAATDDGNVTAVQDLCIGDVFAGPDPGAPCLGAVETSIVVQDAFGLVSPDTKLFPPASFFDVFVDITVDGGVFGTSALNGTVTTVFRPAAPEPAALLLVLCGIVGLYFRHTVSGA